MAHRFLLLLIQCQLLRQKSLRVCILVTQPEHLIRFGNKNNWVIISEDVNHSIIMDMLQLLYHHFSNTFAKLSNKYNSICDISFP